MRQQNHPNVLPLYCSFVHRQHLWMVMPYVAGGSVLNIMKFAYAEVGLCASWRHAPACWMVLTCCHDVQGLEEPIIATILKEVLKGLEYIHRQGGIHRDVKVHCTPGALSARAPYHSEAMCCRHPAQLHCPSTHNSIAQLWQAMVAGSSSSAAAGRQHPA